MPTEGDSAHRSAEIEATLAERGYRSRIHRRPARNRPRMVRAVQGNTTRSIVRARVEHIFGHQANAMGEAAKGSAGEDGGKAAEGKLVRTIGLVRAAAKIGLQTLAYHRQRFVYLGRVAASAG